MENKKISTFLWGILTAAGISTALNIIAHGIWWDRYGFASVSCISEQTAVEMERTARMRAAGEREYGGYKDADCLPAGKAEYRESLRERCCGQRDHMEDR